MAYPAKILCLLQVLAVAITIHGKGEECSHGEVRLERTDDAATYVPIQFCHRGTWKSICSNIDWIQTDARVVCKQLGYRGGDASSSCQPVNTNGYLRSVQCDGTESMLSECNSTTDTDCDNICGNSMRRHAAITCQPDNCAGRKIRLVGGSTTREGRVEVCTHEQWGTVCNKTPQLAGAVCSQLGYPNATAVSSFGPSFVPIRSCTVQNGGNLNCFSPADPSCNHSMDLGVVCRSYEQLCNENYCSTTDSQPTSPTCEVTTCPTATCTKCPPVTSGSCDCSTCYNTPSQTISTSSDETTSLRVNNSRSLGAEDKSSQNTISALGALVGVLVALLVATVTGWIVTCVVCRRRSISHKQSIPAGNSTDGTGQSFVQFDNLMYDGTTSTQPNYDTPGPTYSTITTDRATYDVIDSRQHDANAPRTGPAIPTPVRDETSKMEDDFYDAEEHAYSKVNIDHKKKVSIKPATSGRESPVYDRAMTDGDAPGESGEGYSVLKQ